MEFGFKTCPDSFNCHGVNAEVIQIIKDMNPNLLVVEPEILKPDAS